MFRKILLLAALLLLAGPSQAQSRKHSQAREKHHHQVATRWVDSVMAQMTLEQKVAQLMVIRVPIKMDAAAQHDFEQLLQRTEVGGVCFFVGTARETLPQIRRYQALSRVPLLVCIDAEWGMGMRLKDCYAFPRNAEFGRLPHEMDTLVYAMGKEIGRQCRQMGIHVNFAPVVDVNSNPRNPVIGTRSFSADPERVAQLGIQYMRGLQSEGVMAVAKHFPGHGDTETDSHFDLPVISHTRGYMDSVDLLPFQRLIDAGVEGVMTAHLQVEAYEPEPNHPSSLSAHLVNELLRERMHFHGMVITDGLDMKGVTKYYKDGQGELQALLAGTDILLLPPDVPAAIRLISQEAAADCDLEQLVEMRCRRVLRAKFDHGCAALDPQGWRVPDERDSARCAAIVQALRMANESRIDSIVADGIAQHAFPGCQVLAMRDGQLLFRKAYGRLTYDPASPAVTMQTVYDLASVTKVMATTLAMMKLVETGKVKLDDPLSRYIPYLKHSNKEKITIRQVMSHMARLREFAPFWKQAREAENPYSSVIEQIIDSPLQKDKGYLYSDLGFILLGDLVENVSGQRLDHFVQHHFYHPMGLCHTHFNPVANGIDSLSIAPTELDRHYRNGQVQGVVHDENAFVMGGVSGHAGLFSTADDLARLLQMLLDGGVYGGHRYLRAETIQQFNTRWFESDGCRRGLGFDKPCMTGQCGSACAEASQSSFGHTGFTGTMVWVDPATRITFVFLSNRVYPQVSPNKLAQLNIRTQVMSELYRDLLAPAAADPTAQFGN